MPSTVAAIQEFYPYSILGFLVLMPSSLYTIVLSFILLNLQEAYYDMLVKYREELTRPFQEAMDFFRRVESQLNALTNGSARFLSGNHHHQDVRHDHWVYNSLRPSPDEIPSLPVLETSSSIHVLNWQSNGMRTVAIYFLQTPFMS